MVLSHNNPLRFCWVIPFREAFLTVHMIKLGLAVDDSAKARLNHKPSLCWPCIQTHALFQMRILEMQLGIVVHHFNKLPLPTGNIVSQSNIKASFPESTIKPRL